MIYLINYDSSLTIFLTYSNRNNNIQKHYILSEEEHPSAISSVEISSIWLQVKEEQYHNRQGQQHRVIGRPCRPLPPAAFFVAKTKKGEQGKKEKFSKQKILKGCRQGQNIIVLIIPENLEFFLSVNCDGRQYFSVFHAPHLKIHFAGPDTVLL